MLPTSFRLWFQLTSTIEAFVAAPSSGPFQVDLWNSFIKDFASKLNQLKLVSIGITVARQFQGTFASLARRETRPSADIGSLRSLPTDGSDGREFLAALTEKVDGPNKQEAFVLATMELAHFKLLLGENDATKEAMDKCEKILDMLDSVDLAVHASFYRVSGDYFKVSCDGRKCSNESRS